MRDHYILDFLEAIDEIYDVLKPRFSFKKKNMLEKPSFIKKYKFVNEYGLTTISPKKSDKIVNILSLRSPETINEWDLQQYNNILEYFQFILSCVYGRLDNSGKRLLLHYSLTATYSRTWTKLTRTSRGIIIDLPTRTVIAHPYDKFHNFMEIEETQPENLPDLLYEDAEKLDGSEGILYLDVNGELRIITKGSFYSEQGEFATKVMHEKYSHLPFVTRDLVEDYTFVFEIIYASDDLNRIVVDYGSEPDLRLIGVRNLNTGEMLSYSEVIGWAQTLEIPSIQLETMTLEEMLQEKTKRKNFEGWVRRYENGLYMKIKCEEYLEHHGARFGTSEKAVFNLVREDKWDDFIANVPKEFKHVSEEIYDKVIGVAIKHEKFIHDTYSSLPKIENQKEFALYVEKNVDPLIKGYMYSLRNGKEINFIKDVTGWIRFRDIMNREE